MSLPVIESPKYRLVVPSTQATIEYRPYLVKEEKVLLIALQGKDTKNMIISLKDVIAACTDNAVDPDKLTMFDLEYIFIKLRAVSSGETSSIKLPCQTTDCEQSLPADINLEEIEVEGTIATDKSKSTFQLTDTVGVVLKYATIKDILKTGSPGELSEYESSIESIVASIDSVFTTEEVFQSEDYTRAELTAFIESLSQKQIGLMSSFFKDMPSLKKTVALECDVCNKTSTYHLEGINSFF
jgi:hypothetical protein